MKRTAAALLALLLALPLAGCKPKEMPMGDFALDITPKQTIDIPTGGQGARTLDYLELEVDIPREIPMILPQVKGITAAVTPPAYVDAEIRDGVLVLTGRGAAEGVVLDITLSAPGYEDGAYQFMARVSLHPMELRILGPAETEDVQLDDPLEITQGDVVTLPLSFEEGAAVEISDRTGDEAVEAVIRDGSLVLTALEAGEARLSLCATLDQYDPAQAELSVLVKAKPAPPPAAPAESGGARQQSGLNQTPTKTADTTSYSQMAADIIALTNEERTARGLPALAHLSGVDVCAALRAAEADQLWSHTRPDGTMFNTIFAECGLAYTYMGENLHTANYARTARQVVDAFMDSPDHRENILRETFAGIGVGVCRSGENYYYCQLFVGM